MDLHPYRHCAPESIIFAKCEGVKLKSSHQGSTACTTSRITGPPEPPHPYRVERVFPKLAFKNPLLITNAPGTERLFVGEHAGKIYSFPKDPARDKPDPFLDLTTELDSWDKAKV